MILYHGSNMPVPKPDLRHSRKRVDFGPGFYLTPLPEQARTWCQKYLRRGERGFVSRYRLDESILSGPGVLIFDAYSEDWLDFVLSCRRGTDTTDYAVVMGGVANDKVFDTVELFFSGLIDKATALTRLRYARPNLQVCIRSPEILSEGLVFLGSDEI